MTEREKCLSALTIAREEVIVSSNGVRFYPVIENALDYAISALQEREAVQHGRWNGPEMVDAENVGYKCSECGDYGVPCWNYCPNCGARMDGE